MPRIAKTLTAAQVKAIKLEGNHAVGGVQGLYLQLRKSEQVHVDFVRSWVLRYTYGGRRKNLGLGAYPSVSLADAREKGHVARSMLRQGLDPLSVKRQEKQALSDYQLTSKF